MNLKNILLPCIVFCTIHLSVAQNTQDSSGSSSGQSQYRLKDHLSFNMGGGLMFGNYTNISLLPQLGYKITSNWITGVGLNFQYYKSIYYTDPFLIYGGSVFTRYRLSSNLFAQAEYQVLQYNNTLGDYGLLGGGYTSPDGFYISAYYLVHYPTNNAYGVPYVIRVGYIFR